MPNYFVHTLLRARDWQPRQQFEDVCQWWRDGGLGVCALVGMGGAGKTAVADRFLNQLLGDTASSRLQVAESVFVFSFYDDDKPENFFQHLQCWLEGTSTPDKVKSATQLMFDIQQHHGLMILDGLEKVQESGARGGFGKLTSPSLRELLNHIASGSARKVSVLVTSRFPLTDLRDSQLRFFRTIPVDQIEVAAGIALLRERGVRGSDLQLESIVEHCGRHALTIDLAGGYIKQYGHGDPSTSLNLGTAEELQAEAEEEPNESKRAVLIQSRRFARIAQRYREAMLDSDEAALALLERICLFRLGVDCETLAVIFTGLAAEPISGKVLANLDIEHVRKKLNWLSNMRLVESTQFAISDFQSRLRYTIHPAIRDGFRSGISRDAAYSCHDAVRRTLEVSLDNIPGDWPIDKNSLDVLEEIVYHTALSGKMNEAWDIYEEQIGGFCNLGEGLGMYERGNRICRVFVNDQSPRSFVRWITSGNANDARDDSPLLNEWALYLLPLGRTSEATHLFKICAKAAIHRSHRANACLAYQNLCRAFLLSGCLTSHSGDGAEKAALQSIQMGDAAKEDIAAFELAESFAQAGLVKCLIGKISSSGQFFSEALQKQKLNDHLSELYSQRGVHYAVALNFLGRHRSSIQIAQLTHTVEQHLIGSGNIYESQAKLVIAIASLESGDRQSAMSNCDSAWRWATVRNAKDVICWCSVVRAKIDLFEIKLQPLRKLELLERLLDIECALCSSLTIARDCGYGLYHIDLLLERARLHLLQGKPETAMIDVEVALDTGISANEETGQLELLAANHQECGYAWAIPVGLQLRAEAILLQAAQRLGSDTITTKEHIDQIDECLKRLWLVDQEFSHAVSAKEAHEYTHATIESMVIGRREMAVAALDKIPTQTDSVLQKTVDTFLEFLSRSIHGHNVADRQAKFHSLLSDLQSAADQIKPWTANLDVTTKRIVQQQIDEAQQLLKQALELWQPLHDPEPEREDQNFRFNGKEYNYRAAETWRILKELEEGTLSRYPVASAHTVEASSVIDSESATEPKDHRIALMSFLSELESYETSFSASDDEPIVEFLSVEHPLNRAATELTHFYWAKKLPIKPRHDFRALIAESKICEDFEAIEKLIFALSEWAESESSRLNNMVDQCELMNRSAFSAREQKEQSMSFHVFLSHNSKDKPSVLLLKKRLVTDYQLSVWYDADQLRPGLPWQRLIEDGIRQSESIAVLIGSDGLGPWENEEMQAALQIGVRDGRPVIPVLLPDAPSKPELPMFLSNRTWVDLREGLRKDGLDQLVWGITGVKPNP